MIEVSEPAARSRMSGVQSRTEAAARAVLVRHGRAARPQRVLAEIRAYLEQAFNQRLIKDPPDKVRGLVLLTTGTRPEGEDKRAAFFQIAVGHEVNFKNRGDMPRLTRSDEAWFDFGITLKVTGKETELYAYRFALRFADGAPAKQVRFDLNGPKHAMADFGLRSHVHLNVDDEGFAVPSPILTPIEVLDVLLFRLRPGVGRVRAPL